MVHCWWKDWRLFVTTLSEHFRFYNTDDADAVAADIPNGKSAYVNGGKVVGTRNSDRQVLVDFAYPVGPSGLYTPTDAELITLADGAGAITWYEQYLDGNGYCRWQMSGSKNLFLIESLPAISGVARCYEVWGLCTGAVDDNTGFATNFNWQTISPLDIFYSYLVWNASGYYTPYLAKQTAGSWAALGYGTSITLPDQPAYWKHTTWDFGDKIQCSAELFETDTNTDFGVGYYAHYTASRDWKTATRTAFQFVGTTPDDHWWVKGFRIFDI